jgi:hypothetical protein
MSLRAFRSGALAVVLAVCLAVAACGSAASDTKTAAMLMPEVQAAADGATSVHMAGSVTQGSQNATIDVSFSRTAAAGTVGLNGDSFYFLSLNGKTFIKVDAAFLRVAGAPASVCAKVCGKYVELPAASASQITGSLSMRQLVKQVFNAKSVSSAAASGCVFAPATVNGHSVLQCRQGAYTIDVAAHGKPYLVYATGPRGQHIAFSDWNSVTFPALPPASQLISLPRLG